MDLSTAIQHAGVLIVGFSASAAAAVAILRQLIKGIPPEAATILAGLVAAALTVTQMVVVEHWPLLIAVPGVILALVLPKALYDAWKATNKVVRSDEG